MRPLATITVVVFFAAVACVRMRPEEPQSRLTPTLTLTHLLTFRLCARAAIRTLDAIAVVACYAVRIVWLELVE